ncbi:metallophosphoesterase family protein [Caproicibacter fermentans]|uniref:metallophosphoesterase family protein n=1 Tax=Caproicibacter fermentans TaxID=2576756 RepID=UPI0012EED39E|nr:metallophosphoesterase [Caproicibacter fermentans]
MLDCQKNYKIGGGSESVFIDGIEVNGPYLLAPFPTCMTVAWEAGFSAGASLFYGLAGEKPLEAAVSVHREADAGSTDGTKHFIYYANLKNLEPDSRYGYSIVFPSGERMDGQFKTLRKDPDNLNVMIVGDTHLFRIYKQFEHAALTSKPDFMINLGDIPAGSGYQRDQYISGWFRKIPNLLRSIPVVYIPGNHDDGPLFNDFFAFPQSTVYRCDAAKRTFSFDCGGAHFLMVDSCSWGLTEMNSVNSGLPVDRQTRKVREDTLNWAENDLKSEKARNAKWRILLIHHPYTDEFTNKYMVPIAEKQRVDLMIGGHLHYYIKNLSIHPNHRAVYITQGNAESPEAELKEGSLEERLLSDYPEAVALGKENFSELHIGDERLIYEGFGFQNDTDLPVRMDRMVMDKDLPQVRLSNVEIKALDNLGNLGITGCARNEGDSIAALNLQIEDNGVRKNLNLFGSRGNERVILLNGREEKCFSTVYRAETAGAHTVRVGDKYLEVTVQNGEKLSFGSLKLMVNRQKSYFAVAIDVTNHENVPVTEFPVNLVVNKKTVETKIVSLSGHENTQVEFLYRYLHNGLYTIQVNDSEEKTIDIQDYLCVVPRVKDRSGCGNDALIRGNPPVVHRDGRTYVCLNHNEDYLEIPCSESLIVDDEFSGIVEAKINRLAKDTEMGHNPLMVKGKSVGWGATYLIRMVVERSGMMKWGTCYGSTEYAWEGGKAALNKWTQYTLAFSKESGGDSYCDEDRVSSIPGVEGSCQLRNWENDPLFIGYSYIGHVIREISRPKYFTHLSADIGQVRFYRKKLTDRGIAAVFHNPKQRGPAGEKLAVWLDFDNICDTGAHTTEWRRPAEFKPAYKMDRKLWNFEKIEIHADTPETVLLEATVEVSDDEQHVNGLKKISIKNGAMAVDLSDLQPSQFIRIRTIFKASLSEKGTFIPRLREYRITASNGRTNASVVWATRRDWEKGEFEGAVGFEPVDRLRVFDEYTDVIHG